MTIAALGGIPVVPIGAAHRQFLAGLTSLSSTTLDAAAEAVIMVGQILWEDGGSHTVDTTGSSSIGWRSGSATFANGSTITKVGIAEVDATAGPPPRAANAANVISFDVSADFTGGGGGITANAWQTSVPTTGTKTIAHGALIAVAIQMTARGGADTIDVSQEDIAQAQTRPAVTNFTGGSYARFAVTPNVVITASDGTLGFIGGGYVADVGFNTQTWNSGSATKEYGNLLQFPVPVRVYGIIAGCDFAGNTDLVLYSDPLGTPVAEKTLSVDLNQIGLSNVGTDGFYWFTSTFDLKANTPYAAIAKPTSVTNVTLGFKQFASSTHQKSEQLGTNCYAINRASGAFAAQNSNKDRFTIGFLVGAFEHGVQPTYALGI